MINFSATEKEAYTLVEFALDGPITPDLLPGIKPPDVNPQKGVVVSGRGPIWLYGYLLHHYHPCAWVAVFDPRLGAVVVQSHTPTMKEGSVIKV